MIQTLGEHPECELKLIWKRDTPHNKAEFVKDVQAIANSAIAEGKEKYIVVGANEKSKVIDGCSHSDFDDADLRTILENHLDPVPEFEVLRLQSSQEKDFVVVRIPHQPNRPFVVRASIREQNRTHLEEGQIWLKPGNPDTGSTGKRLLRSRSELIELIDVEPRIQRQVAERVENRIPAIRLEERSRLQGQSVTSASVLTSSDEEFESYIEHLLASPNQLQLNIVIEKLRERTVEIWGSGLDENQRLTLEEFRHIKESEFLPSLRRLVLVGLLLIKFSAPIEWVAQIANLLLLIFDSSNELMKICPSVDEDSQVNSLGEHTSFSVPAVEALTAAYLLAGYELSKRNTNSYLPAFLNRVVKTVRGPYEQPDDGLFMFWRVTAHWGSPNITRFQMALERYGRGDRIEKILGGKKGIKAAIIQTDCLVDWHSFLSFQGQGEPETVQFYERWLPTVRTDFHPNFTFERYEFILPMVQKLWSSIFTNEQNFWLFDPRLAEAFLRIDTERRKQMLARFLLYAQKLQSDWMWANGRFSYDMPWPEDIAKTVAAVRATQ